MNKVETRISSASCMIRHMQLMMTGEKGIIMTKKYGIWNIVALTADNEVVKRDITATSGKDAKSRMLAIYANAEILKMTRKVWLDGFSYAELSAALTAFNPYYADALMVILDDFGVFSAPVEDCDKCEIAVD